VRWNVEGKLLASAGDEAVVFLWHENDIKNQKTLDNCEDENIENWYPFKTFRGHLEDILDISWSEDSQTIVTGSIDNSVMVWNVASGKHIAILKEPKGFVQGVCFEPTGATFAVLSTDRCLRIYSSSTYKCLINVNKMMSQEDHCGVMTAVVVGGGSPVVVSSLSSSSIRLFHDDTMKSFFRRMSFSSDGNFLITPSGCLELVSQTNETSSLKTTNTSYIFLRTTNWQKPVLCLPHDRPSVAASFNPIKFQLNSKEEEDKNKNDNDQAPPPPLPPKLFSLSYRYVFAIATEDSVFIYDTQNLDPFAFTTGIHYSNLSDLSWSSDGQMLMIASIDGFCTFVSFKENELGTAYVEQLPVSVSDSSSSTTTTTTD
jgi:chromatin assembly factor 1 subunit B